MYCDGSIIIMWSLNFFISAFPLTCLLLKSFVKQSESDLHIVWRCYNFCQLPILH